jgi:hypothetical protein
MDTVVLVLKWLSQVFILVVGVWALFSDTSRADASTGGRKLTRSGWAKVAMLTTGLLLFAFTERRDQIKQQSELKLRDEALVVQKAQLDNLRRLELTQNYRDRLTNSTVENELAAARATLHELKTISDQYRDSSAIPDALWRPAEELTHPEYVEALYQAHLIDVLETEIETEISEDAGVERRWRINDRGSAALATGNLASLRELIERSRRDAQRYGITVDKLLFARYWGVAVVVDSSYANCIGWHKGQDHEPDNRIFGWIKTSVIAGVVWRRRPYRAGEDVYVKSNSENDVGIRGCPKLGDVIGYVEEDYAQMWEKIFIPPKQHLIERPGR